MWIICLIFPVIRVFGSNSFIINDKQQPTNDIISRIISQFTEHNMIFHYGSTSGTRVDSIIQRAKVNGSYLMANYDLHSEQTGILQRPTGYKFLHVVLLKNYTAFNEYTDAHRFSLKYVDVLLFVTNLGADKATSCGSNFALWDENVLDRAGGLFVLDSCDLSLYTICFFCGELTGTLRKIDGLSVRGDNDEVIHVPILNVYTNKFNNFNQHRFLVGYNVYRPLFWYSTSTGFDINHTIHNSNGLESELLILLHEKLNIDLYMIAFSSFKNPWAAVVNAVSKNTLDLAIGGITLTLPRTKIVAFTTKIRTESYAVLYSLYNDPWLAWQDIILPFQLGVWLLLVVTVLVISFLFFVTIHKTGTMQDISMMFLVQGCFRYLIEQALPTIPTEFKARWTTIWLMFLWLIVALIINCSYKSKVTSSMINSKAEEFDSIDQLVDRGYHFQMNNFDSSVLQDNLKSSSDPKFLEVLNRFQNDSDTCPAVLKTIQRKMALIDEETKIQSEVHENCRKLMGEEEADALRLIRDDLFPSSHAWPMPLHAPYRARLDTVIGHLHAAGIFVKWAADYSPARQLVPRSHQAGRRPARPQPRLALASILGPAIIWTLGALAATLVFIGELIRGR